MLPFALDFWLIVTKDYADGGEQTPNRNLRRLRKQTAESKATVTEEHDIHVAVEVKGSDPEGLLSYIKIGNTYLWHCIFVHAIQG